MKKKLTIRLDENVYKALASMQQVYKYMGEDVKTISNAIDYMVHQEFFATSGRTVKEYFNEKE